MTIESIISDREIKEVLHFTTGNGFTGIMATGFVKPRSKLPQEKYLEHIIKYNCSDRSKDKPWWGHVNLSLTRVNSRMFNISKDNWHANENCWWCILAFSPELCTHDKVTFTTTNNIYTGVRREQGRSGLEAMFALIITRWDNNVIFRNKHLHKSKPTCEQAEVLYPVELSLDYLKHVYVDCQDNAAKAEAIASVTGRQVCCEVRENWSI